jgi:copper chaperone CopZ
VDGLVAVSGAGLGGHGGVEYLGGQQQPAPEAIPPGGRLSVDAAEMAVVVGGILAAGFVLWYFFPGRVGKKSRAGGTPGKNGSEPAPVVPAVLGVTRMSEPAAIRLKVGGMTCQNCVRHVSRALEGAGGVVSAEVDLDSGTATVRIEAGSVDAGALVAAVRDAGYEAERIDA